MQLISMHQSPQKSVISDSSALAATRREQMERILRLNAENQVLSVQEEINETRKQSESAVQASIVAIMNADSAIRIKNEARD